VNTTDALRPLTAPGPARRRGRRGVPYRRWMPPFAVAVATALLVVGVTVLPRWASHPGTDGTAGQAGSPGYAVAIGDNGRAEVVDAVSGKVAADLAAPEGAYVAVAGGQGVFYLAAQQRDCLAQLYQVTISSAGDPDGLAPLPNGRLSTNVASLALAGDGEHLAISGICGGRTDLTVVSIAVAAKRLVWVTSQFFSPSHFAWASDNRTLDFFTGSVPPVGQLWSLDTEGHARSPLTPPLRKSIRIQGPPHPQQPAGVFVVSPTLRTLTYVITLTTTGVPRYYLKEYSTQTGRTVNAASRPIPGVPEAIAADRSGRHLVMVIAGRVGRVDGGHFSWVTRASGLRDVAW
jgi:hypothetical protein